MPRILLSLLLLLLLAPLAPGQDPLQLRMTYIADRGEVLAITVLGDDGKPLDGAMVLLQRAGSGYTIKNAGADGRVAFEAMEIPGILDYGFYTPRTLVVAAPEYAPFQKTIAIPDTGTSETIRLSRGEMIELQLLDWEGNPMPQATRVVGFTMPYKSPALRTMMEYTIDGVENPMFNMASATPLGGGYFLFQWDPELDDQLYLVFDSPGTIRYAVGGPFTREMLDTGELVSAVPKPGGLSVKFDASKMPAETPPPYNTLNIEIHRMVRVSPRDTRSIAPFLRYQGTGAELAIELPDLAPGDYYIDFFTGVDATRNELFRPSSFSERKRVQVVAGETRTAEATYKPSKNPYAGDYRVNIQLLTFDGKPVEGINYTLTGASLRNASAPIITAGKTGKDGRFTAHMLAGNNTIYQVFAESRLAGSFKIHGEDKELEQIIRLPPGPGDIAPEAYFVDLDSTATLSLASLRGQIVVLEFWATWCGPCQTPMSVLNELMYRRGEEWKDRVTIVAASTDINKDLVINHVGSRSWTFVRNVWTGEHLPEYAASETYHTYGVSILPTTFIIDRDGTILWRGLPTSVNMEKTIDRLLEP